MTTTVQHLPTTLRTLGWTSASLGAVLGGVYFAFSSFVLPGLDRAPASAAIRVMSEINLAAPRGALMLPFLGSAAGSAAVGIWAAVRGETPGRAWLIAGGVAGVIAFLITAGYHLPHNDALLKVEPDSSDAASKWRDFYGPWMAWNHARTVTALASAAAFTIGLVRGR